MTTRLYLLRHGIAFPHGTPGLVDDDRPLTSRGEDHVEGVARGLRRLDLDLDAIVTSPLPRARQTADVMARVLDLGHRVENADALRPPATAGSIREWLATRAEDRVMLVGHNPNLTALLGLLLGLTETSLPFGLATLPFELKKGGLAELRADGPNAYRLQWLTTPRLFRRLRG